MHILFHFKFKYFVYTDLFISMVIIVLLKLFFVIIIQQSVDLSDKCFKVSLLIWKSTNYHFWIRLKIKIYKNQLLYQNKFIMKIFVSNIFIDLKYLSTWQKKNTMIIINVCYWIPNYKCGSQRKYYIKCKSPIYIFLKKCTAPRDILDGTC